MDQVSIKRVITERPQLGIAVADLTADGCGIVSDQANAGALSSREELGKNGAEGFNAVV
jgi:hypothetical protein